MAEILPPELNMEDFIAACQRPLRKSVRVNTLKISVEEFKKRAEDKRWALTQEGLKEARRLTEEYEEQI